MTIDEFESTPANPEGSPDDLDAVYDRGAPHPSSSPQEMHKRRFGRIIAADGSQVTAVMEHFAPGEFEISTMYHCA
jgi:hypothetical protein